MRSSKRQNLTLVDCYYAMPLRNVDNKHLHERRKDTTSRAVQALYLTPESHLSRMTQMSQIGVYDL